MAIYGGDVVRNQVPEISAWACCTQGGRSTYAEIASQACFVLSAVRKMYRPAGDERQQHASGHDVDTIS